MDNKKKVIVANYRYHITGGPEVYMFKFMDKSDDIGYESIPFSVKYTKNVETPYSRYFIDSRSDSVYYEGIKKNPKSIYRTLQGAFYNKQSVKNITKLIDDEKPQVLYALQVINTLSPSIFKAAKKKGLKVIHRISDFNLVCPRSDLLRNENPCELCLTEGLKNGKKFKCCHGSSVASYIRVSSMKYHRRKQLYKYVDYFITPTEFTRNILIKGGFEQEKIIKVPTFIDSSKITPKYSHENYVLFLGRLGPEKGAKYAVEAMKYLLGYENLKIKVTGKLTENEYELRKIIKENKLEDRVVFTGFVRGKELENLISNSIALLCPAIWYDNMPNTVLEAYSYGKPVIASNMGCFPELVEDGKTGFLFEPKNSMELANKIKLLLDNENEYIKICKQARAKVETDFSPEKHFSRLKEIFEK